MRKSTDKGRTWTEPKDGRSGLISKERMLTNVMPIAAGNGRIYVSAEQGYEKPKGWCHQYSFVMSSPAESNLLDAANWTKSTRVLIPPEMANLAHVGWLEGNMVQRKSDGKVFNILRTHGITDEVAAFYEITSDGKTAQLAGYRGGEIAVFRNSEGAFDDGTVVYEDKASPWTQRVYWRDLDSDGHPELFCAKGPWGNQVGASLQLVKQYDTRKMKVRWRSSPQTAFHGFAFQDVDNDGDADVIASDYANGGNLFLYLNNGGNLAAKPDWSVKTNGPAHEAVLGDIDQDGDLDLAVGCRDQAHIYENLTTKGSPKPK